MKSLFLSENFLLVSENMWEIELLVSGVMFSKLDRSYLFWCVKLILLVDCYDW